MQPNSATSSTHTLGHPPAAAFDSDKGTYWEEGRLPPSGRGQILTAHFSSPVHIRKIGFDIGISDVQKTFVTAARPRRLHLVFSSGVTKDITLADTGAFQSFSVDGGESTSVSFEVREVAAAGVVNPKISIREIELFTLSP